MSEAEITLEEMKYRIERLEFVLGTLITWSMRELGEQNVIRLMSALVNKDALGELKGSL